MGAFQQLVEGGVLPFSLRVGQEGETKGAAGAGDDQVARKLRGYVQMVYLQATLTTPSPARLYSAAGASTAGVGGCSPPASASSSSSSSSGSSSWGGTGMPSLASAFRSRLLAACRRSRMVFRVRRQSWQLRRSFLPVGHKQEGAEAGGGAPQASQPQPTLTPRAVVLPLAQISSAARITNRSCPQFSSFLCDSCLRVFEKGGL